MRVVRPAYAKVNLALSVRPPLPPGGPDAGTHPIASWMHAIDLCDQVEIERLDTGPSRHEVAWDPAAPRRTPIDWPLDKDLAVRAHRVLERVAGRDLPLSMRLAKRIPVGGGLGGGSSDAAASMLAINHLFDLGLSTARLAALARELGSDVAFFLDDHDPPRPALVQGLGDRIDRLPRARGWVVLLIPDFGCPTGRVYRAFDALPAPGLRDAEVRALAAGADALNPGLFNDLLPAAQAVRPALRALRDAAESAAQRPAHLSGSGSTLFIPAADQPAAGAISAKILARVPDVMVVSARLV